MRLPHTGLYTAALLTLTILSTACADDAAGNGDSGSSETTGDGDGDPTTGDGDGDPTTGDGDGDPTTGDGDGDPTTGDGDGDPTTGDGDGDPTGGGPIAVCGNGIVDGAEECDDAGESVDCDVDCTIPACGDGQINLSAGEQCEDGNLDNGDLCSSSCVFETVEFSYTGAAQQFVLPDWVSNVTIEVYGAQGGGALCCDNSIQDDGGLGGYAVGTYAVMPGETLWVYVGGQGVTQGPAGWNGGGTGGEFGAGGGGASDVRIGAQGLADRIIVGGGGGGGNCGCPDHGEGGAGGGLDGVTGTNGGQGSMPGGGGTQVVGGAAGSDPSAAGQLGVGGGANGDSYHVGAGGGGYYGGGGAYAAGGGGGSSYYGGATDPETMPGVQAGNGLVTITPAL